MQTSIALRRPRIDGGNQWTREEGHALVLHPNGPGDPPVRASFSGLSLAAGAVFETVARTRNDSCPSVVLRVEALDRITGSPVAAEEIDLAGAQERPWQLRLPSGLRSAEIVLSCRLAPQATGNRGSGVLLAHPRLTVNASNGSLPGASVSTLFEGRVERFFREAADRPNCIWVLHHLPKTAGTSLHSEIGAAIRPRGAVFGVRGNTRPEIDRELEDRIEAIAAGEVRFATGHFTRAQIDRIQEQPPPARVFTFLRHPVARAVSDYRYIKTPRHPQHQQARAEFPTLSAYLASPKTGDGMFRRLRRTSESTVAEVIADIESSYTFVGLTERYDLARRALFRLLRRRPSEEPLVRNRGEEVSGDEDWRDLADEIRAANRNDLLIYQHFSERFLGIERALEEYLDAANGA